MIIELKGLADNPTPYRVYEFFYDGGGFTTPMSMGLKATFLNEADAIEYVKKRTTRRIVFRIAHENDIKETVDRDRHRDQVIWDRV